MPGRKGESIGFHDERAVVQDAGRARPTDGTLHQLHDDVRHDERRQRAARRHAERTVRAEWNDRAGDAEPDTAQVREDGPEQPRRARRAFEDGPANEQLAVARLESLEKGLACMSGYRAGRFVRPGEDFMEHRSLER